MTRVPGFTPSVHGLRFTHSWPHGADLIVHSATQLAPQINTQNRHADKHRSTNHEPLRQVGVDNGIWHVREERPMLGFNACSNFELGFGNSVW